MIVFGTNDCASLAHFYIEKDWGISVTAFTVDREYMKESTFEGKPVVPFEDLPEPDDTLKTLMFIPLYDNRLRAEKYRQAKRRGYKLFSYLSSKATIWDRTAIGENCFIMENNVIQPYAKLGNNVILWSGNHIGHHSEIGDNVFVASHVVVSGHVKIGEYSWLGVNSCIRDGIALAENTFVAMGAVVTKNTIPDGRYYGNPAERKS